MKPKISIIVPVYNVEQYIHKCIQSLTSQTYNNIEIILVNDGSPDNCPIICEEYSNLDTRIKTIHKPNGGLSDARNVGIKEASGEYVLFVDSDDYIENDACERFVEQITNKPDIVVGNAIRIKNNSKTYMKHTFSTKGEIVTGKDYVKKELLVGSMHMAAWLNVYKRTFLLDNNLEFKLGLLHEDEDFTPRVFLKAERVIGTDITFYNYLIRDNSITQNKDLTKNALHLIQTCRQLEKVYERIEDNELKVLLNDSLVTKYLYAFQMGALYRKQYENIIDTRFIKELAQLKRTKAKVMLFCFNRRLYYTINKVISRLRMREN